VANPPTPPSPPWADLRAGEVILHLRVQPRARQQGIAGVVGQRLKLRVSAAPEAGRANDAVLTMIARIAEVPPTAVTVIRGALSRDKTVRIATREPVVTLDRLHGAISACATA
jgi:uncharacterized protein (TIGR00251 family)